jgi:hypothetical protein
MNIATVFASLWYDDDLGDECNEWDTISQSIFELSRLFTSRVALESSPEITFCSIFPTVFISRVQRLDRHYRLLMLMPDVQLAIQHQCGGLLRSLLSLQFCEQFVVVS